jgi:transglutaminase-like putative cysteine protease
LTALAATAACAVVAALAAGSAALTTLTVPSPLSATAIVVGASVSARRWGPPRGNGVVRTLLTGGTGIALVISGALVDSSDTSIFDPLGEVVVMMLVVLSFGWVTPERCRTALVFSLAAVLFGAATRGNPGALAWLFMWLVGALVALMALNGLPRGELKLLAPRPGAARTVTPVELGRRAGAGTAALLLITAVALLGAMIGPAPRTNRSKPGGDPNPGSRAAPYVGFQRQLDTSARGELGDEKILTVWADAPEYWRGQTFDWWDGRTWSRSPDTAERQRVSSTFGFLPPGLGDVAFEGEQYTQRVRVEAPYIDVAFASYRVEEIHAPEIDLVSHGDGTVTFPRPLGRGAEYTVVSVRPVVTAALLRDHDPADTAIPGAITRPFLQLPDVTPRVQALARDITAVAPTTYDKVRAIESWMDHNTTYTLDIPPLPPGADAVDQHLFVDRKGFCEQIATSTTVMLRSLGIPARLAVGFVPGDESILGGEWTVRAKQAHAWVEVWFPGIGWQAFDPTASVPLSGDYQGAPADRLGRGLARLAPLAALLAIVVVLVALWLLVTTRSAERRRRNRAGWAETSLARLEKAGGDRGRPRAPLESPAAYGAALADTVLPDPRLVSVGGLVSAATYGSELPPAEARQWAEQVLDEAEAANPPPPRRSWRRGARRGPPPS